MFRLYLQIFCFTIKINIPNGLNHNMDPNKLFLIHFKVRSQIFRFLLQLLTFELDHNKQYAEVCFRLFQCRSKITFQQFISSVSEVEGLKTYLGTARSTISNLVQILVKCDRGSLGTTCAQVPSSGTTPSYL